MGVSFDVTVVVGPGSEDTWAWLREEHPDAKRVDCPLANLGISRNLGWRHAGGDLIAFIDDDAVALPGWLDMLAEPFVEPRVGAVGGFVRDHTGARWQWQYLTIDPLCNPVEIGAASYRGPPVNKGPLDGATLRFPYPPGTNMMFRRTALELAGGFDETLAYAADDAELCLRLYNNGWHIAHAPMAEVIHRYAPSHQRDISRIPRTLLDTVRSFVYVKLRHGRRHFPTAVVLESVYDYLARTRNWVHQLERGGHLAAADSQRLRGEIDEGARDAVRRVLSPSVAPGAITASLDVARNPRRFAVPKPLPRRLRLCFVARELPPAPSGGIGIWVRTLGRELARLGHETHLIAGGEGHATMNWVEGAWVHRAPTPDYGPRRTPDLSDLPSFIRNNAWRVFDTVARLEARHPFDMICAPLWEAQGIALRRGRRGLDGVSLHTPMRTVIRTSRTWTPDEAWLRDYGRPLMAAEAELAERSAFVLANSMSVVEEIEREYNLRIRTDRLAVVPHGVEDFPHHDRDDDGLRPMLRLLFVGRFEGRKGIDILLGALPALMQRHPNAIAELIGEHRIPGPSGSTLLEAFHARHRGVRWLDRIRTPGVVDDAELCDAYRNCDVFVAPSRFESFGLIFLEAMRFAKPVVALDSGGAREIIRSGENGLLVAGEDPAELEAALHRVLSDSALRAKMGRQARATYEARFTAATMASNVVDAIMRRIHRGEDAGG
jgi:glycosyltransferase involved in cell wall biosynthesis/GT2 family glycosyltransferase